MKLGRIAKHYFDAIGNSSLGWVEVADGTRLKNKVLMFNNEQTSGLSLFATVGMSSHVLTDGSGKHVRQELTTVAKPEFGADQFADDLFKFMRKLARDHIAIERGEIISAKGTCAAAYGKKMLYCTFQSLFGDELAVCMETDPVTEIVWLIPIDHAEAEFVRDRGWRAFEQRLEDRDVDVADLRRVSAVLV